MTGFGNLVGTLEYMSPEISGAGIKDSGDVRMVHHRQRLALSLKPGDDLPAIHTGLDQLERHHAPDRFRLLGHLDRPHPSFANLLDEFVWADDRGGRLWGTANGHRRDELGRRIVKEAVKLLVMRK